MTTALADPTDVQPATGEAFQPAITWLNMTGDVTITWDESNRDDIIELVRQKMAEGYSFFVLTPRLLPVLGSKKTKLTKPGQLKNATGVVVPDSQVQAILARVGDINDQAVQSTVRKGKAHLTLVPKTPLNTTRRATTPEEVVKHQSVAVRAIVGG